MEAEKDEYGTPYKTIAPYDLTNVYAKWILPSCAMWAKREVDRRAALTPQERKKEDRKRWRRKWRYRLSWGPIHAYIHRECGDW